MRRFPRAPFTLIVLAVVALAVAAGSAVGAGAPKQSTHPVTVGIGDEQPTMFSNPAFSALHTTIARYVTPYDVAAAGNRKRNDLPRLKAWLAAAKRAHIQPLVAFYHSDRTPTRMPSVKVYTADVKRAARVLVRAWTPEEKEIEIEADDLLAVALQHEIDHLDGKLFIDRISRIKRELYRRKLAKLIKEGKADGQRPSSVRI